MAPRARRPVLPTLTAVLAGALVAGTASMLAAPSAPTTTADPGLRIGLTEDQLVDIPADLVHPTRRSPATTADPAAPATPGGGSPAPVTTTTTTTTEAPPTTTTTTQEPEPEPRTTVTDLGPQDAVVALVNDARADAGCAPVTSDARLTAAAQAHAEDMSARDYFAHDSLDGRSFDQRIRGAGYDSPGAENIARGADNAEDVMRMWMNSDGHRRNILNCDLSTLGVGLDTDGYYWVQDFGY